MTQRLDLYRCETCGNIVQVLVAGDGELVCCGHPMTYMEPHKNDDNANEKHVPVFVKLENGEEEIRVGSLPHPMEQEHYIQFIEAVSNDERYVCLKFLNPGDEPVKKLHCASDIKNAIAYCNIHGLWEGKK